MSTLLPGIEGAPPKVVRRLTADEDALLRRHRQEKRQMELRHKNRLEHVLANLSNRWPAGISHLWKRLNTGHLGIYTRVQVDALVSELISNGEARKTKRGVWRV